MCSNIPTPIYIENALELLDEPGEWYLDRPAKTVYYMPRQGEDMTNAEVIVPAVEKLVELRGTLDRPVHNIRFEGLTFQHGGWLLPNKIGFVDVQANFLLKGKPDEARRHAGCRTQRVREKSVEHRLPRGQVGSLRAVYVHQAGERRD